MIELVQITTDKRTVIEYLSRLPDDATLEEIRYEFETIHSVLVDSADADGSDTIPHEVVVEDIRRWRQKAAEQRAMPDFVVRAPAERESRESDTVSSDEKR